MPRDIPPLYQMCCVEVYPEGQRPPWLNARKLLNTYDWCRNATVNLNGNLSINITRLMLVLECRDTPQGLLYLGPPDNVRFNPVQLRVISYMPYGENEDVRSALSIIEDGHSECEAATPQVMSNLYDKMVEVSTIIPVEMQWINVADVEEEAKALPRQYYANWETRIPGGIHNLREHRARLGDNDPITRNQRVRQALREIAAESSSDESV